MVDKWTNLIDIIVERNLISKSVWNLINEIKNKNVQAKQSQEDRILKGIEDLIKYNTKIEEEVATLAKSEFKMLFMVATYARTDFDKDGIERIVSRRKKGFIFEENDYYTLDYSNIIKSPTKLYNKKNGIEEYPGADYLIKDLQDIRKQFVISYRGEDSDDSYANS